MTDSKLPGGTSDSNDKLSADEAAALIKAIEDVEREEAEAVDSDS